MYPQRQRGLATHKECAYFNGGLCVLNSVRVSPDGPACPNFKPRSTAMTPAPRRSYEGPRRLTRVSRLRRPRAFLPPGNPEEDLTLAQQSVPHYGDSVCQRGVHLVPSGRAGGRGRHGRARGRGIGGPATDVNRACICPTCGYTRPLRLGTPCFWVKCPDCGAPMIRKRWCRDEHARRIEN